MDGTPEVYFRKPYLKRQRVVARHRQNNKSVSSKINTSGIIRRWWDRWMPGPIARVER